MKIIQTTFLVLMCLAFMLGLYCSYLYQSGNSIFFISLESVTDTGGKVYNRVKLIPGRDEDVWLMQQSQRGLDESFDNWDLLAIVVDKRDAQRVAKFYKLESGNFDIDLAKVTPLNARCQACHANGPRAIRPKAGASNATLPDRLLLAMMNLRISTYGGMEQKSGSPDSKKGVFEAAGGMEKTLNLSSCNSCHSDSGIRNPLTYDNAATALFLVEKGMMPPFPYRLDKQVTNYLNFVLGN